MRDRSTANQRISFNVKQLILEGHHEAWRKHLSERVITNSTLNGDAGKLVIIQAKMLNRNSHRSGLFSWNLEDSGGLKMARDKVTETQRNGLTREAMRANILRG